MKDELERDNSRNARAIFSVSLMYTLLWVVLAVGCIEISSRNIFTPSREISAPPPSELFVQPVDLDNEIYFSSIQPRLIGKKMGLVSPYCLLLFALGPIVILVAYRCHKKLNGCLSSKVAECCAYVYVMTLVVLPLYVGIWKMEIDKRYEDDVAILQRMNHADIRMMMLDAWGRLQYSENKMNVECETLRHLFKQKRNVSILIADQELGFDSAQEMEMEALRFCMILNVSNIVLQVKTDVEYSDDRYEYRINFQKCGTYPGSIQYGGSLEMFANGKSMQMPIRPIKAELNRQVYGPLGKSPDANFKAASKKIKKSIIKKHIPALFEATYGKEHVKAAFKVYQGRYKLFLKHLNAHCRHELYGVFNVRCQKKRSHQATSAVALSMPDDASAYLTVQDEAQIVVIRD